MGFNRRKMEDQRREAAEKEAAAPGDRSAWRVLAESWLLLAAINDIESRRSIEVNSEATPSH